MFSLGLARVKLGEQSREAVWWLGGLAAAAPGMLAEGCARRFHRGQAEICLRQLWALGMGGGREIPFVSPIPFLVLSRRGSSLAFQGMGYWSAQLSKQSRKAAASRASKNWATPLSEFCQGIPEEGGCPFQPGDTRSRANVSDQAFAYWVYQGTVWYEK